MAMPAAVKSRAKLLRALKKGKGSIKNAAKILGVSQSAVSRAMDRYAVARPRAHRPRAKKIAWDRDKLMALMARAGWDLGEAARIMGIAEETIARQLDKHGVRPRREKLGRPSVAEVIGKGELKGLIQELRGNRKRIQEALGITNYPTLIKLAAQHGLDTLDCWVKGKVTKKRLLELLRIHKGDRAGVADALCITKGGIAEVARRHKVSARQKPGWTYVPRGRRRRPEGTVRTVKEADLYPLMEATEGPSGKRTGILRGRRARLGYSYAESVQSRRDPAFLWLKEKHGIKMPVAGNPGPKFRVRSAAQGLRTIEHEDITSNWRKSLKVKPKHKRAVLVPCAGTKPFPDAPSHRDGYLRALEGKAVDVYVVSEPLGVVPYEWSRKYPQDDYDFPPRFLKGEGRELLVERIAYWLCAVGKKYDEVVAALPEHHAKLVDDALQLCEQQRIKIKWAGIGECLDDGACPPGHFRPTSHAYRGYLKARVNPPVDRHYVEGGCYHLALAVNEITGWPLVVLVNDETGFIDHVGVLAPDGRFVDGGGAYPSASEAAAEWGLRAEQISPEALAARTVTSAPDESDKAVAARIVGELGFGARQNPPNCGHGPIGYNPCPMCIGTLAANAWTAFKLDD